MCFFLGIILMKLLLIHQSFVLPSESGGTRHYELGKAMVAGGHQFSVITSDVSYLSGEKLGEKLGVSADGINVLRVKTSSKHHKNFIWRIYGFINFMFRSFAAGLRQRDVDVVMGTTPPIFQALSAWAVAMIKRKPFVLEVRDLWPDFAVAMGVLKNKFAIKVATMLEKFLYKRAAAIIVNSPAYIDHVISKGVQRKNIHLIPNGVDIDMFHCDLDAQECRQKLGLPGNKFLVTYAGALGMANDIATIIKAAVELRSKEEIHFLIAGDGKEKKALESIVDELGCSNITFMGSLPKVEIPLLLKASDLCLATLLNIDMFKMTYPNKVFDYMAAKKPVILAIDGVIRDVVETANAGIFVSPGDVKALATAVLDMQKNHEKCVNFGEAGYGYVTKHFARNLQAENFIALLETISAGSEVCTADGGSK